MVSTTLWLRPNCYDQMVKTKQLRPKGYDQIVTSKWLRVNSFFYLRLHK